MPQIRMRDAAGTLRTITQIRMRDESGVLRTIQRVRMRDAGNVLRTVFQAMTVTLSTLTEIEADSGAASNGLVTSDSITSSVSGGTGPYTYEWQYVSGNPSITADTPTADNTTFSSPCFAGIQKLAVFKLQVTDSDGVIGFSEELTVALEWHDTR